MRRLRVAFRPEAGSDLSEIYRWIYQVSRDPRVAGGFLDRLISRCKRIGDAPLGGRPRDELERGMRTIAFERSAVIAYRVETDRVLITNVFYGGRNFETLYRSRPTVDDG